MLTGLVVPTLSIPCPIMQFFWATTWSLGPTSVSTHRLVLGLWQRDCHVSIHQSGRTSSHQSIWGLISICSWQGCYWGSSRSTCTNLVLVHRYLHQGIADIRLHRVSFQSQCSWHNNQNRIFPFVVTCTLNTNSTRFQLPALHMAPTACRVWSSWIALALHDTKPLEPKWFDWLPHDELNLWPSLFNELYI